jgi:HPt (histidine-containing phosphotransfer) domain-containing protein
LPVIGLTAHAMAEARQHCLEVGMVEHVTKPIDLDRLVESIRRHLPLLPIQAASEAAAPVPVETVAAEDRMEPTPDAARPVIDWDALEQRYAGRQDFIDRLLTMLRSHYAESAAKLRAAIATGQVAELMALAHSLKGMAGNLCAEALQEQARRTEQAARADAAETAELAEGLAQLMDKLISEAGHRR